MLSKIGVGAQLIIAFILLSILSVGILLFTSTKMVSENSRDEAFTLLSEISANYGGEVSSTFNYGLGIAHDALAVLQTMRRLAANAGQPPSREEAVEYLKAIMDENKAFLVTIWTGWEPDAFDGRDQDFKNAPNHDATGRFIPLVTVDGQAEPLTGYDQPGAGDYYLLALKSGREHITEPYEYETGGRKILMVSMAVPVMENGRAVGVVGVDMGLDRISAMMAAIKPMGVGRAMLISPGGMLAGHTDSSLAGQSFQSVPLGQAAGEKILKAQADNRRLVEEAPGGWPGGTDACSAVVPFTPGQTSAHWAFVTSVPKEKVLEKTAEITVQGLKMGGLVLVLAIVFGLVAVKFVVGGLTRRILNVVVRLEEQLSRLHHNASAITSSSQHIAEGAQSQAAALEETSAAIEETASMTKRTADNATETNNVTRKTSAMVEGGSQAVGDMGRAMEDINQSSTKISGILKTIEDIAFQTNLLALNAAVEAARAGEAGAGFAVVAEEVRNLAMRSAEAANSTAELIESTIKNVQNGTRIAQTLTENFTKIEDGSMATSKLINEIAAATQEQSQGLSQVNLAMASMDKVTQDNAGAAGDLAQATGQLTQDAEHLNDIIEELLKTIGRRSQAHREPARAGAPNRRQLPG